MRRRRPRSAEGRILERIARKHIPDDLDLWPAIAARVQPERERAGRWSWFPRGPLLEAAVISVIVVAIVSGIVVWGQWGATEPEDAPATTVRVAVSTPPIEQTVMPVGGLPNTTPALVAGDVPVTPSPIPTSSPPPPPPPPASQVGTTDTAELAILFVSHRGDVHDSQIFVMNPDGSNERQLTFTRGHSWRPRVAPNRTGFFFSSVAPGEHTDHSASGGGMTGVGNHDTFVATFTGSTTADLGAENFTNITAPATAWDSAWSWSPDGSLITFTSDRSGNWEIWTMTPDGQDVRQITNDAANDGWPVWTPDGSRILFSSDRSGNWEIYSMDPSGQDVRRLTDRPDTADLFPEVSPDGTRVVFSSQAAAGNTGEIYSMDLNGEQVLRLTNTAALNTMPSWCPSGDTMVFVSNRDGNDNIFMMNADGSNVVALTDDPGEDTTPHCAMVEASAP
jgi:TolB protein